MPLERGIRFPVFLLKRTGGVLPWRKGTVSRSLMCGAEYRSFVVAVFLFGSALFSGPMPTPLNSACFRLPHHSAMREGVYALPKPMKYGMPISNHEGFYPCARDSISKLAYRPWSDWCVDEIADSFFTMVLVFCLWLKQR